MIVGVASARLTIPEAAAERSHIADLSTVARVSGLHPDDIKYVLSVDSPI